MASNLFNNCGPMYQEIEYDSSHGGRPYDPMVGGTSDRGGSRTFSSSNLLFNNNNVQGAANSTSLFNCNYNSTSNEYCDRGNTYAQNNLIEQYPYDSNDRFENCDVGLECDDLSGIDPMRPIPSEENNLGLPSYTSSRNIFRQSPEASLSGVLTQVGHLRITDDYRPTYEDGSADARGEHHLSGASASPDYNFIHEKYAEVSQIQLNSKGQQRKRKPKVSRKDFLTDEDYEEFKKLQNRERSQKKRDVEKQKSLQCSNAGLTNM